MNDTIPHSIRTLLTKLAFISMIYKGSKPCFRTFTFTEAESWGGFFYRLITRETYTFMVDQLREIVDQSDTEIKNFPTYAPIIIKYLLEARKGIINLQSSYKDKLYVLSSIKVILEDIDIITNKIQISSQPIPFCCHEDKLISDESPPKTMYNTPKETDPEFGSFNDE